MRKILVRHGDVLVPEHGTLARLDVVIDDGTIQMVDRSVGDAGPDACIVDATNAWVLPGIVDLHGDAFERAIMPRPSVTVAVRNALADNDVQLLAAGITTAFVSVTDSWEPGLRSRAMLREIIECIRTETGLVDRLVHVRHERCNTDEFDELVRWIGDQSVHMVSYNDHAPGGIAMVSAGVSATQVGRSGVKEAELVELQAQAITRRGQGFAQDAELAAACRAVQCPTASHDAHTLDDLERDVRLGVRIAEFPTSIELAQQFLDRGIDVLLGAPNLIRGGSHLGNLSVRDAIAAGAGNLLCSDYHYPSLLQAPFLLDDLGLASFGEAWAMVSANPAAAAGLADRGQITPGARADIIVVEPPTTSRGPRVRSVICDGTVVSSTMPR